SYLLKCFLDLITAERVAIFFGLLSTCLIVALVIVIVHRDSLWSELEEAKRKLDVLEDYIQKQFPTGTATRYV
ncbi:hypothetical protein KR074_001632, partial [Drosophila pseudoananassae]